MGMSENERINELARPGCDDTFCGPEPVDGLYKAKVKSCLRDWAYTNYNLPTANDGRLVRTAKTQNFFWNRSTANLCWFGTADLLNTFIQWVCPADIEFLVHF